MMITELSQPGDEARGIKVTLVALQWNGPRRTMEQLKVGATRAIATVDKKYNKDVMDVRALAVSEDQQCVQLAVRANYRDSTEAEEMAKDLRSAFAGEAERDMPSTTEQATNGVGAPTPPGKTPAPRWQKARTTMYWTGAFGFIWAVAFFVGALFDPSGIEPFLFFGSVCFLLSVGNVVSAHQMRRRSILWAMIGFLSCGVLGLGLFAVPSFIVYFCLRDDFASVNLFGRTSGTNDAASIPKSGAHSPTALGDSLSTLVKSHFKRLHQQFGSCKNYSATAPHWRALDSIEIVDGMRSFLAASVSTSGLYTKTFQAGGVDVVCTKVDAVNVDIIRASFAPAGYLAYLEENGFFRKVRDRAVAAFVLGLKNGEVGRIDLSWVPPTDGKAYQLVVAQDILTPEERREIGMC